MVKSSHLSLLLLSTPAYFLMSTVGVLLIVYFAKDDRIDAIPQRQQSYSCQIKRIIDGDSVMADCQALSSQTLEVRLLYIDAPELTQPYWGKRSREALSLLLSSSKVSIQFAGRDYYHRYLGEIYGDNNNINLAMVGAGMAMVYSRYHPPQVFIDARQNAKKAKRGIWQTRGLHQDPQRFRRLSHE